MARVQTKINQISIKCPHKLSPPVHLPSEVKKLLELRRILRLKFNAMNRHHFSLLPQLLKRIVNARHKADINLASDQFGKRAIKLELLNHFILLFLVPLFSPRFPGFGRSGFFNKIGFVIVLFSNVFLGSLLDADGFLGGADSIGDGVWFKRLLVAL